jgi:hypothetical protein
LKYTVEFTTKDFKCFVRLKGRQAHFFLEDAFVCRKEKYLYVFFWVIPQRLNFICQRFGTLCLFHLCRLVGVGRLNLRMLGYPYRRKFGLKIAWAPVWIPQHSQI